MAVDLDALHRRIKGMYWDNEPAPPPPLRAMLTGRRRRLGSATPEGECPPELACADPYALQFVHRGRLLGYPTTILQAALTHAANTRSRVYMGAVRGPARLQWVLWWGTATGNTNHVFNVQILPEELPNATDDGTTTYVSGPWVFNSLWTYRGLPGIAHVNTNEPRAFPVNVELPDGLWHLHAWTAASTLNRTSYAAACACPIYCEPDESPDWPESYEPAPEEDPGDPILWIAGISKGPTDPDSRTWTWSQGRWHLTLLYGGGHIIGLPQWTAQLNQAMLVPHKPQSPGSGPQQTYAEPVAQWIPVSETRS